MTFEDEVSSCQYPRQERLVHDVPLCTRRKCCKHGSLSLAAFCIWYRILPRRPAPLLITGSERNISELKVGTPDLC